MLNRGDVRWHKVVGQMRSFGGFLQGLNTYERVLWSTGKVTIHCKTDADFEVVQALTLDKDVYSLQVGNSFSIFVKGWDK
ncbi:putative SSB protein [Bacillus phage vB_BcgM]|nr:putative SSB protein [Bacillus phage vB_BcgM]